MLSDSASSPSSPPASGPAPSVVSAGHPSTPLPPPSSRSHLARSAPAPSLLTYTPRGSSTSSVRDHFAPRNPSARVAALPVSSCASADASSATPSRPEPRSLREAWSGPDAAGWRLATDKEMASLREAESWELVLHKPGDNVVKGQWIFRNKHLADGTFEKHKARWVAKGFTQVKGIDFTDTFAPTLQLTTFRTVLQLAASFDLGLHHLDINTAFLQAPLEERILMEQPHGYVKDGPNGERLVCFLRKSQYGLKQASRNFSRCLRDYLFSLGFAQAEHDPCLYTRGSIGSPDFIAIAVWVDDLLLATASAPARLALAAELARRFKMDDRGPLASYLSFQISRPPGSSDVFLHQTSYARSALSRFGFDSCVPVPTTLPLGFVATKHSGPPYNHSEYRARCGMLQWLQHSRPDITHAVNVLARFTDCPSAAHFHASSWLLRYISGTLDLGLTFRKGDGSICLEGYSDSSFADCPDSLNSTCGFLFRLNPASAVVSFSSRLQKSPATSTCHAEYVGLYHASCEAVHLRGLLVDLGILPVSPGVKSAEATVVRRREQPARDVAPSVVLKGDNSGSIDLAHNPVKTKRNKHFEAKLHFTRHLVEARVIALSHVGTKVMWADGLTKTQPAPLLQAHRRVLLGEAS